MGTDNGLFEGLIVGPDVLGFLVVQIGLVDAYLYNGFFEGYLYTGFIDGYLYAGFDVGFFLLLVCGSMSRELIDLISVEDSATTAKLVFNRLSAEATTKSISMYLNRVIFRTKMCLNSVCLFYLFLKS